MDSACMQMQEMFSKASMQSETTRSSRCLSPTPTSEHMHAFVTIAIRVMLSSHSFHQWLSQQGMLQWLASPFCVYRYRLDMKTSTCAYIYCSQQPAGVCTQIMLHQKPQPHCHAAWQTLHVSHKVCKCSEHGETQQTWQM